MTKQLTTQTKSLMKINIGLNFANYESILSKLNDS